ncbi:ribonuclease H-like domain-containing protein [Endothiovibrio diazotrophicus]
MLSQRLKALRRQAGAEDTSPPVSRAGDVAGRIARLRPSTTTPPRSGDAAEMSLARRVGGERIAPGMILIERRVSLETPHGRFPLSRLSGGGPPLAEAQGLDPGRMLFFDTETSGLAGGSGTVAFMLGLGRVVGRSFVVRQYLLTAFSGEPALLRGAGEWLAGASALVSFNGKSFDAPLLATRYRLSRLTNPFQGLPHIDLLAATRRAYSARWPDCRLATAERELLQFRRSDDLPGAEAPAAWLDWLRAGDGGRLPGVARHNYWDILSLAALLPLLGEVHADPAAWSADPLAVARSRLRAGDEAEARRLLARAAEVAGDTLEPAALLELARLHRRQGAWHEACAIWEPLAERGEREALEQLAKYHEHRRRDYAEAMRYARRLPVDEVASRRSLRLERRLDGRVVRQASLF